MIQIIAHSADPLFDESLVRCEQIILCILAMADRNPAKALDYVRHSKEKIGMFYADQMWAKPQIQYAVRRYCDRHPQAGLNALVEIAIQDPESLDSNGAAQVMATVALHEPELVLEAVQKLPAEQRLESWRAVISQAESTEECTRLFKSLRIPNRNDPSAMKSILTSLGENISSREMPWKQQIEWLESLDLSDSEKRSAAQGLTTIGWEFGKDAEYASWLVEFMPVSTERNYLVWRATIGFWTAADPESAGAFLKQQGIDPDDMIKLDREGYLRK